MQALPCAARVVAKIEKVEAYERLDEIIAVSDGVMVARGDYGIEAGVAHVPLMQKDTISRATQAGKLVITATQMLESMIHSPEPTRAEATDVANAVIDGSSAVMLSAETSVGDYPVEAVQAMAEIAEAAEQAPEIHGRARKVAPDTAAAVVMHAAVELARDLDADALVVPTATGGAPRACAKYRPPAPDRRAGPRPPRRQPARARVGRLPQSLPVAETVDEMIEEALIAARDAAGLPAARVILTARPHDRNTRRDQPHHGARDPLGERADAGDVAPHDQGLHRLGSLVGVDHLDVAHVADHVVLEQDAVASEQVTRLGDHERGPCACC